MTALLVLCAIAFVIWGALRPHRPIPPDLKAPEDKLTEELELARQKWAECRVELYRSQSEAQTFRQQFEQSKEQYDKLLGQKKSSEVKTGFMAESLLPLTEQFPCDPKSLRFLGAPIDYISFDYSKGEITFIECKTGDSQLNEHQRKVRDMIENGRVKFVTVRLNEKGIKVK